MKRLLTAIAVFGFLCVPVLAATRYTDDNGAVTSGTCTTRTVGSGACTATYAASQLAASDTLIFLDGIYDARFGDMGSGWSTIPSGSAGNPTILKAENANAATWKPTTGASDSAGVIYLDTRSYITIDGIVINGTNTRPNGTGGPGGYNVWIPGSTNITLKNGTVTNDNLITGVTDSGMDYCGLGGPGSNLLIQNMEFSNVGFVRNTGAAGGCAVYFLGNNSTIEGSYFHDNGREHIQSNNGASVTGAIIRNNRLTTTHTTSESAIIANFSSAKIYNNLIYGNAANGVMVYGLPCTCEIYNNVFYNNGTYGVDIDSSASGSTNTIKNNIFLSNSSGAIQTNSTGTNTCSNNMNVSSGCITTQGSTDPFVDKTAGTAAGFHLTSDDNGGADLFSAGVTTDYAGTARPSPGPPDRGAFEFGTTAVAGPSIFSPKVIR